MSVNKITTPITELELIDKTNEIIENLPGVATTSSAGIVQPDGTSITINNGVISSSGTQVIFRDWSNS